MDYGTPDPEVTVTRTLRPRSSGQKSNQILTIDSSDDEGDDPIIIGGHGHGFDELSGIEHELGFSLDSWLHL